MNTFKNLNHERTQRRADAKRQAQFLSGFLPKRPRGHRMISSNKHKPAQPTIISLKTAFRLRYLEEHGLADFDGANLVVDTARDLKGVAV